MQHKRNYCIDILKFIFSVILVLFHSRLMIDSGSEQATPFANGAIAVEFYFIVSGYLMAQAENSTSHLVDHGEHTLYFMIRKVKPLILPIWCTWLISFIGIHMAESAGISVIARDGINSIFEILFLKNAGFKGYFSIPQTWYISAMLISIWICHPFLHKYKQSYISVAAPLIAILLLGYLSHTYSSIRNLQKYAGFIYKSQLRALAEINLGIFCYRVSVWIKHIPFNKRGVCLISIIEVLCYSVSILYMYFAGISKTDFSIIILLAIAVTITFTQKSYLFLIAAKLPKLSSFLGNFSLYLYLEYYVWARILPSIATHASFKELFYYYIAATVISAYLIMKIVSWIEYDLLPRLKSKLLN